MAKLCYSTYFFIGTEEEIQDIYEKLSSIQYNENQLRTNRFTENYLGNIPILFDISFNKSDCKGIFSELQRFDKTRMGFSTHTNKLPMNNLCDNLILKYKSIRYYYQSQNVIGNKCITNDKDYEYFPEKYIAETENNGTIGQYINLRQLYDGIGEYLGVSISCHTELDDALFEYNCNPNEAGIISIREYRLDHTIDFEDRLTIETDIKKPFEEFDQESWTWLSDYSENDEYNELDLIYSFITGDLDREDLPENVQNMSKEELLEEYNERFPIMFGKALQEIGKAIEKEEIIMVITAD